MEKKEKSIIVILVAVSILLFCLILFCLLRTKTTIVDRNPPNEQIAKWSKALYEKNQWERIDSNQMEKFPNISQYQNAPGKSQWCEQRHPIILHEEKKYWCCGREITKNKLGHKLDINTYETLEQNENETIEAIYEIQKLNAAYTIAVKCVGDNKYYLYGTHDYVADSLSQYCKDLNINRDNICAYMTYSVEDKVMEYEITYFDIVYLNESEMEEMLENCIFHSAGDCMGQGMQSLCFYIYVYLKDSEKRLKIGFSREGELIVGDMDICQTYAFEFGEEKIKNLLEYIEENMKGYCNSSA